MATGHHIIVLLQTSKALTSRQWSDYDSVGKAMDGICQLFEQRLKQLHPDKQKITYDINSLFEFIDNVPDFVALVQDPQRNVYCPHDKQWIKKSVFNHLKKQASNSAV